MNSVSNANRPASLAPAASASSEPFASSLIA